MGDHVEPLSSDEPIVRIVDVHKGYGSTRALRGTQIDIRKGEFLTLLGPSGSGKTTLLNVIAGFLQPDSGAVTMGNQDITNVPVHKRNFGLVFQHYALFPHMTVHDNVAYPLRMRRYGRELREETIAKYLSLVELDLLAERYPRELSGGQQQRVALARALVFGPPLLLMDEPLGALDRRLRQSIQFRIKDLQSRLQATVIHVTHDQEEAMAMSDRIAVMHDGLIEQVGSPNQLYTQPATPFVAGFIGETNRLAVIVSKKEGEPFMVKLVESGHAISLEGQEPTGLDTRSGSVADLHFRPEDVRLKPAQPGSQYAQGTLVSHTYMGDHVRNVIRVGSETLIAKEPPSRDGSSRDLGQIAFSLDRANVRIFYPDVREQVLIHDREESW